MKVKVSFISILMVSLLLGLGATSCVNDFFDINNEIGEGEATLSARITFSPVKNALDGTRASGTALKHIDSLCVFIYDQDGKLYRRVRHNELLGLNIENNNNATAPDAGTPTETNTPVATFSVKGIPFGKYYIYAVANMGNLDQYTDEDLETPDRLKEIELVWDADNVAANDQMFGYFTLASAEASEGFDAPLIAVNQSDMPLHAWVKRAASKVTVAIDGSALHEGVQVYIKSIQIRDIPKTCFLGKTNTPNTNLLIREGERTDIATGDGAVGDIVSKTQNYPADIASAHLETANAYYFFENMQGTGQSKNQDANKDGILDYPDGNKPEDPGHKDGKIAGSYIEVTGWYVCEKDKNGNRSEGPIIYRFMLGKDTDKDYNAQRNYHYKLTLKLRNYANDSDWHIVYDKEPDILVPNPYYISYLYNQTMNYTFTVIGHKLISLKAEIPENEINKKSWAPYECNENDVYWTGDVDNPGPWNGFLSLRKTIHASFGEVENGYEPGDAHTYTYNKTYWDDYDRGEREYTLDSTNPGKGLYEDKTNGDYRVSTNGGGEWNVTIPFYTRARVMVAQTGYTGNNPFVAYQRNASVKITAVVETSDGNQHTISKDIEIRQARRIVNPKGIWRSANCTDEFHVQLKILPNEAATKFQNLESHGPWVAVIQNGDWFDIIPTPGVSQKNTDGTISGVGDPYEEGNPGKVIDFTFKPKGTTTTPRGGLIKIYYNNYSCIHWIFVRQGYEPVSFPGSSVKWHSSNLSTLTTETEDPAVEGSYFRRYNTELPIDASNNTADMFYKDGTSRSFKIAGSENTNTWSNIRTSNKSWPAFTIDGKTCRIASKADFNSIVQSDNTIYGYGVIYTDGTKETKENISDVYGARAGAHINKGMRGVFVCDSVSGAQLFLPIGASGYGRFKQVAPVEKYNRLPQDWGGVVQYANRYKVFPDKPDTNTKYAVQYKPLFYNLYKSEGALYWLTAKDVLDINYFTLDFALTDTGNTGVADWGSWAGGNDPSGTDALQLRLVED